MSDQNISILVEKPVISVYLFLLLDAQKRREAKMRNLSETTNAKVAWLSLMSISVCIAVAALQLWHLQRYFRKKKLI